MVVAATAFSRGWPLLLVLLALPTAGAADLQPFRADFQYSGELHLEGRIDARCPAWGARLGPLPHDGVSFAAATATLVHRTTWSNVTAAGGREARTTTQLEEAATDLGAGPLRLVPQSDAGVALYPAGTSTSTTGPLRTFSIHAEATRADLTIPLRRPMLGFEHWRSGPFTVELGDPAFPTGRLFEFDGTGAASGAASLYLRGVRLEVANGRAIDLGRYLTEEVTEPLPGLMVRTQRYEDAFLEVQNLRLPLPAGTVAVCNAFQASVDGGLSAADAAGRARQGDAIHEFSDRVLSLSGRFAVNETTRWAAHADDRSGRGTRVTSVAQGDVAALALDYAPMDRADAHALVLPVGLVGAALVAAALVAKHAGSLAGLLYARFGPDQVLDHPRRSRIYERIQERPGLDLSQLALDLACPLNSLIYHVRVLERTGKVGTIRHGKSLRLLVRDAMPVRPTHLPRALLAWDPQLTLVHELLAAGPQRLTAIVGQLAQRFGMTRRGALHVIERGVRRGLLVKDPSMRGTRGRGTVVRCA